MKRSSNENSDSYKTSSSLVRFYNRLGYKSRFMRPEIKLDAVLAAMTDAVVITDAKGIFIDFNEPFAKLNRFKTKLECAKALSEYTVNFSATTPEGVILSPEQWPIMRALYGESGANLELIVTRSDTNERWIGLYNYAPIRTDNGTIVGAVLTGRDITEFRETEEHLRNLSSRLHLALTSAHLGVWEWDIINDKLTWDDRMFELYGVAREDFTTNYSAWTHGVHPEDRGDAMERISQALQGERDFDTQFRVVHPNGTIRYLKAAGLVLCGTDGKPQRMLGVNADITEEKLAKDKLHAAYADIENKVVERTAQLEAAKVAAENANKAKDLFLATLSHELRSPLSAILSWTQLMERGMLSHEKLQVGIRAIKESVWAQNQLIGDLLDLSRIHTGKLAIERQPTDVIEVLKAAIEMIRPNAEQHDLAIEESFDSQSIYISADPARLKQSFWNVLSNAVKFTPSGGKISACVKCSETPKGPMVQIAIKDTGKGIKPDFITHIFERFSQADPTSIRVHGGMGLGLPLVKSLTELQDGTVTAQSPGEGLGSTFILTFPLLETAPIAMQYRTNIDKEGLVTNGNNLRNIKVLLVEDGEKTRVALAQLLASQGASVRSEASAKDALLTFKEFRPDVLVSDIAMPQEDGHSLLRKIRALGPAEGGNTPAIALTAYAESRDRDQAFASGFQEYLNKPIDVATLANSILKLNGQQGL